MAICRGGRSGTGRRCHPAVPVPGWPGAPGEGRPPHGFPRAAGEARGSGGAGGPGLPVRWLCVTCCGHRWGRGVRGSLCSHRVWLRGLAGVSPSPRALCCGVPGVPARCGAQRPLQRCSLFPCKGQGRIGVRSLHPHRVLQRAGLGGRHRHKDAQGGRNSPRAPGCFPLRTGGTLRLGHLVLHRNRVVLSPSPPPFPPRALGMAKAPSGADPAQRTALPRPREGWSNIPEPATCAPETSPGTAAPSQPGRGCALRGVQKGQRRLGHPRAPRASSAPASLRLLSAPQP